MLIPTFTRTLLNSQVVLINVVNGLELKCTNNEQLYTKFVTNALFNVNVS